MGVSSPNQKLLCAPAALSKMRVWTLSLGKIGPNYKAYRQFVAPIRLLTRRPWYMASLQSIPSHVTTGRWHQLSWKVSGPYWPLAPVVLESVQSLLAAGTSCPRKCPVPILQGRLHPYVKIWFCPLPSLPPSPPLPPLPPSPLPLLFRLHNGELCEAQSSWHHP